MLSKKLTSVRNCAVVKGDDKAPYYISGIIEEQRKKNSQVFNDAMKQLADINWSKVVFDDFPSFPYPSSATTTSQVITRKFISF